MKLSPALLKQLIAEEVQKLNTEREVDPSDKLIDYLKEIKIKESKVQALRDKADRALEKIREAKTRTTKKLLKKI